MDTKDPIRQSIEESLADELNGRLAQHGFSRRRGTLAHRRLIGSTRQEITFHAQLRPPDDREVIVDLAPFVGLYFPDLNAIVDEMREPSLRRMLPARISLSQPAAWVAPTEVPHVFRARAAEEVPVVVRAAAEFTLAWVVPFLDDYKSAADVVRNYERGDRRIPTRQDWALFVAAGYLAMNDREGAARTMATELGSAGLRRTYAAAWRVIESKGR